MTACHICYRNNLFFTSLIRSGTIFENDRKQKTNVCAKKKEIISIKNGIDKYTNIWFWIAFCFAHKCYIASLTYDHVITRATLHYHRGHWISQRKERERERECVRDKWCHKYNVLKFLRAVLPLATCFPIRSSNTHQLLVNILSLIALDLKKKIITKTKIYSVSNLNLVLQVQLNSIVNPHFN